MRQLKVALRRLWQSPGFAAAAIGTLALGIAAPTALFAVVNATLLRPLPYPHADNIYTVRTTMTDGRFTIGMVASEEIATLGRTTDLVTQSTLSLRRDDTILTDTGARQVTAVGVTEGFFELFGLPMSLGHSFTDDDYHAPPASRVVLSERTWRSMFGGDPRVVGTSIRFAGTSSLVVGVAPEAFAIPREADVWFAQHVEENVGHGYDAYLRLKPGVTAADVQSRLGPMWEALAKKYPDQERNRVFVMRPLLQTIVGDLGPFIVIAFAATGLLLLLAIVNVANLLLARGTTRGREMAVRTALGATRWDLLVELLAESLSIAAAATIVGLVLASAAIRAIVAISGASLPRVDGMRVDLPVFLFSAVVMIVAGLVIGLLPAATMAKTNLVELVNEGGRGRSQGRATKRVLAAMIVAEVALAIALVAGAGRLVLSVQHLLATDPGFTSEGRLAIDVLLPPSYGGPTRIPAWVQQVEERLRALGATQVAEASSLPLRHEWDSTTFVDITGRPIDPAHRPNARLRVVSPAFFDVFKIRIVAGRPFTVDDRRDGQPVVVINQAWAKTFIPDLDPLQTRINPGTFGKVVDQKFVPSDAAIIGVVQDVPYQDLTKAAEPIVYVSSAQVIQRRLTVVVTTADGHPERLIPEIRAELQKIDPNVPVDFASMPAVVSASLMWPRLGLLLMSTFGIAGLVLAATGVFGVIAFVTSQRANEMAVRLAIGATRGHVFGIIVWQGGQLALLGMAIGVLLAWWMGRLMGSYVYHVSAANVLVLGGSAAAVFAIAVVATLPSARRAATIDAARTLKS